MNLVDQIITAPEPAESKLRHYCASFETTLSSGNQDKVCLGGMIGTEIESLNHSLAEHLSAFYRANQERIAMILTEGRKAGEFRFTGDINDMAVLIYSSLQGGMLLSRASGGVTQYRKVIEQMIRMVKG